MITDEILDMLSQEGKAFLSGIIKNSVVVKIQNVADYYYETPKDIYTFEDFPCVAPPWPSIWMEWSRPSSWISDREPDGLVAQFCMVEKLKSNLWKLTSPVHDKAACLLRYFEADWLKELDCRWFIEATGFGTAIPGAIVMSQYFFVRPNGEFGVFLTSDERARRIITRNLDLPYNQVYPGTILAPRVISSVFSHMDVDSGPLPSSSIFDVPFLALTFCYCKNIATTKTRVDEPLRKKREKNDRAPIDKFYTLQIKPFKEVFKREGRSDSVGILKAMRFCRGTFHTYGDDSPGLFGKYHGRYFIPMHLRGRSGAGVVKKDYRVVVR